MAVPLYELILNEESGITCISLVDRPAIEVGWVKFAAENEEVKFQAVNAEKRILFGPVLIPNQAIKRIDPEGNEFYVVFSKDTIENIRNRYHKAGITDKFNAQHEANITVNGYVVESFLKDTSREMIPPSQFAHLPDGTWFASLKVEDDTIWNRFVDTGVFTGFSIEGNFAPKPVLDFEILDKFQAYLDEINTK